MIGSEDAFVIASIITIAISSVRSFIEHLSHLSEPIAEGQPEYASLAFILIALKEIRPFGCIASLDRISDVVGGEGYRSFLFQYRSFLNDPNSFLNLAMALCMDDPPKGKDPPRMIVVASTEQVCKYFFHCV